MRIAGFGARESLDLVIDREPQPVRAVFFDFSNTLFHLMEDSAWLRAVANEQGVAFADETVTRLVTELEAAWTLPEVVRAQEGRDLSTEAHRAAGLTWIRAVEELAPLAEPLYEKLTAPESWLPYDDTEQVLTELRGRGVPLAVVSDIAWDIRPTFAYRGLDKLVDRFALSYEWGVGKPDAKLFLPLCDELGVDPQQVLMVGDTPVSDGGSATLGMRSYILPADGTLARRRGLDIVLQMVDT